MNQAFIGLGSNIEPRKEHLDRAIEQLKLNDITVKQISAIYETAPVGFLEQANFLNMAIEVQTDKSSDALLDCCQEIEQFLRRKRTIKNGPRTIDLDILLYNEVSLQTQRLEIPHPRLHERAFVLVPLCDIAPHMVLPGTDNTMQDYLDALPQVDKQDVKRWEYPSS